MSSLASPYRGRSSQLLPHPFRIAIPEILSYLICVIFAQMSQSVAGQKLLEHIVFFFPNLIVVEFVETCAVHIVFTFSSKSHWQEGDSDHCQSPSLLPLSHEDHSVEDVRENVK